MNNALDLTDDVPRSPRFVLGGCIIAARALDKCRAVLNKSAGEYHFDCPLDNVFFDFAGITGDEFKEFVATGACDKEVGEWISDKLKDKTKEEIVLWNNSYRDKRVSEMAVELQVFLEDYIAENIPEEKIVYNWFDIYDIEEGRI